MIADVFDLNGKMAVDQIQHWVRSLARGYLLAVLARYAWDSELLPGAGWGVAQRRSDPFDLHCWALKMAIVLLEP